mmetsp:Transcript_33724/g.82730  ORF Transcript_33724/g.82730 Transcript_33724/m.82730 type:complete len:111 (-) Transcript_33724:328-660(-)
MSCIVHKSFTMRFARGSNTVLAVDQSNKRVNVDASERKHIDQAERVVHLQQLLTHRQPREVAQQQPRAGADGRAAARDHRGSVRRQRWQRPVAGARVRERLWRSRRERIE